MSYRHYSYFKLSWQTLLKNCVDPDQLASEEDSWSESTLIWISIHMVMKIGNVWFNNTRLDTVYIHMYIFFIHDHEYIYMYFHVTWAYCHSIFRPQDKSMHVIEKDFLFLNKNICCRYMSTQKNRPNELVLLSCQKPFFCRDFPKPNLGPNMPSQLKKWAKTSQNGVLYSQFLGFTFWWKFHENLPKINKVTDVLHSHHDALYELL